MHLNFLGVYIAETVHPSIRNNLTIIPSIFMSAYILTIPSIMVSLCLIALPESPYWLVEAQKIDLAKYVITTKHLPKIIWKSMSCFFFFIFQKITPILSRKWLWYYRGNQWNWRKTWLLQESIWRNKKGTNIQINIIIVFPKTFFLCWSIIHYSRI